MLWLIGTAFGLRNFLTLMTLGGFGRIFQENRDLLVCGGVWAPTQKKSKRVEIFIFRCGFKKIVFVKNGAILFRLQPLVPPIGTVRTQKT